VVDGALCLQRRLRWLLLRVLVPLLCAPPASFSRFFPLNDKLTFPSRLFFPSSLPPDLRRVQAASRFAQDEREGLAQERDWCVVLFSRFFPSLETLTLLPHFAETLGTPGLLYLATNCIVGASWIFDFMAREFVPVLFLSFEIFLLTFLPPSVLLSEIKRRYNIKESSCVSCLKSCYCVPCDQRQLHRELLMEEQLQWGTEPNQGPVRLYFLHPAIGMY
jgi:hypothetical protein